ncbi:adenylyl-sulfate kinase [Pullulanibacillus sp. KACC 23026]|uniref:adenylyl-sulfate kinase n=1 Tax=Pullulanibacillus sp. KACC 23026 TaxID=3028315 RepID=UPI0023AEE8F7|nr:adenylyl-sulfate kinase [Pullulanibacillus sp. KACC 23026]WEG11000.1 adenylyl-sulfate kinase [Pullulanibacillus sp. KACC 23026]
MEKSNHLTWHKGHITKKVRQHQKGHKSYVLWFTGLSGSGKSTLSVEVEKQLVDRGIHCYRLDGDNCRHGLNKNLGFSPSDRKESIRRMGEVAKLFVDAGLVVLAAFISPYQSDRNAIRELLNPDEFIEIYVKCSVDTCEKRDPKGLYQKARQGEIKQFTGIDAPYEPPAAPELVIDTEADSLEACTNQILNLLEEKKLLKVEKNEEKI